MAEWVHAELDFGSFYSYRVPGLSPSFAVCSPLPSPAAVRLALVDAVIRRTGRVQEGEAFLDLIKQAPLELQPPPRLAVMKFFLKRLKPEKPTKGKRASAIESTGVREYCLPYGPIGLWVETEDPDRVAEAFLSLRRLGTTDSLAFCTVGTSEPNKALCLKSADNVALSRPNFARRPVFTLHELDPDVTFEQINPYARAKRGAPFQKRLYIMPLVRERAAENWVIYRREPFES
jgi:hypothetical protein